MLEFPFGIIVKVEPLIKAWHSLASFNSAEPLVSISYFQEETSSSVLFAKVTS